MADGTSLGWGIALGSRFKNDYSGNEVIEDAFRRKAAADAQKEKEAVSNLDFKIDYGKYLPVYGKLIANEQKAIYDKYAQYKQQDKTTAFNRILPDIAQARQKISAYELSNDAGKKYLAQDPTKNVIESDLANTLISHSTNPEDLVKYNRGKYIQIGPQGEFGFRPVPQYKMDTKYEDKDFDVETQDFYSIPVPGKRGVLRTRKPSEETILRKATERVSDPVFLESLYYSKPELEGDAKGTLDAAIELERKVVPIPVQDRSVVDLPNPSSASTKEKRKPAIVELDSTTFIDNENLSSGAKKTTGVKSAGRQYASYDRMVNVPDAQVVTIPVDSEMLKLNPQLKGEKSVSFKTNNIVRGSTGKKKDLFALGVTTLTVPGRPGSPTEAQSKTVEIIAPYNKVKGTIEETYDLSDVDELIEEEKQKTPTSSYKYKVTKGGKTIYSSDGETWVDEKGNSL